MLHIVCLVEQFPPKMNFLKFLFNGGCKISGLNHSFYFYEIYTSRSKPLVIEIRCRGLIPRASHDVSYKGRVKVNKNYLGDFLQPKAHVFQ